jgi:hypothetical protein
MIRPDRRTLFAALVIPLAMLFLFAPGPTWSRAAGAPPFCVARGGVNGPGGSPENCAYSDYQACLQAAADVHGNCVQNIDYHGDVATVPAAVRTRHRR